MSNIIAVVLSLVIIVVIVSNVILWSYQMNQLDWDRMQENVIISNVVPMTRSPWYVTQSEYTMNIGDQLDGSYLDTQAVDGLYERFSESPALSELNINGTFSVNLSSYPSIYLRSVEIVLRYRVDDTGERWFLEAYNWTSKIYADRGFNSTSGHAPSVGWNSYAVNLTDNWQSYVGNDGRMMVKLHDQFPDAACTNVDIDFLGVRVVRRGTSLTFESKSARSVHFVSIWVNNSTVHRKYDADVFVNSGETFSYQRFDIQLPNGQYVIKAVTERGNSAIYTAG